MSVRIDFDTQQQLVMVTFEGPVELKDILAMRARVASDPRFNDRMARVLDMRLAEFHIAAADVQVAAQARRENPLGRKLAFIVSRSVDFGLTRMMQGMLGGDSTMRVFYDMEKALRWLQSESDSPK